MENRWQNYEDPLDGEQINAEVLNVLEKISINTLESSDVTVETKENFNFKLMETEIERILEYHKDPKFVIKVLNKLKDGFDKPNIDNSRRFKDEVVEFLNGEIKRLEEL